MLSGNLILGVSFSTRSFTRRSTSAFTVPMLVSAQEKCIGSLGPVVLANWRVWPVINYINFRLIPTSLRVLFMNVASVAWNAFFCTIMAA